MRDFPTITTRRIDGKKAPPNSTHVGLQKKNQVYHLQANNGTNPEEGTGKLQFFLLSVDGLFLSVGEW